MSDHKIEYLIKDDEKIVWDLSADWLDELEKHLSDYLKPKRFRDSSHEDFVKSLRGKIFALRNNPTTTTTLPHIVQELRSPSGVKKIGANQKESHLFQLCHIALVNYDNAEALKLFKAKIDQKYTDTISGLQTSLQAKTTSYDDLKSRYDDEKKTDDEMISNLETFKTEMLEKTKLAAAKILNLETETSAQQTKLNEQAQIIAELQAKITQQEQTIDSKEQRIQGFTKTNQGLMARVEDMEGVDEERAELQSQLDVKNSELTKQREQIASLTKQFQQNARSYSDLHDLYQGVLKWLDNTFSTAIESKLPSGHMHDSRAVPAIDSERSKLIQHVITSKEVTPEFQAKLDRDIRERNSVSSNVEQLGQSVTSWFNKGLSSLNSKLTPQKPSTDALPNGPKQ